ncbi:MAG: hypothetical protein AB7F82_07130 [Alphaproteobacteria bacterium]
MLCFRVVNLLIPGNPGMVDLPLPSGTWTLTKGQNFASDVEAIGKGQCVETYILEHPVSMDAGSAAVDEAFDEITPILLAASYATGLSVTIKRSTPGSECMIMQPSEHWPRDRAMGPPSPVVALEAEFIALIQSFVQNWPQAGQTEKARLLVHHWLDALSCWSMEDLYLSTTTLLQIIVATEATRQGNAGLRYYPGVTAAANHKRIRVLGNDFKNMRNELIHDGRLIGSRFAGPDKAACAAVVADVLNWFDDYLHTALGLGSVKKTRFRPTDFQSLNAYSIS